MSSCTFPVTPAMREVLQRSVRGEGGFQDFLRDIGERAKAPTLTLSDEEIEKVERYAQDYGQGGFQDRLETLVGAINKHCKA